MQPNFNLKRKYSGLNQFKYIVQTNNTPFEVQSQHCEHSIATSGKFKVNRNLLSFQIKVVGWLLVF